MAQRKWTFLPIDAGDLRSQVEASLLRALPESHHYWHELILEALYETHGMRRPAIVRVPHYVIPDRTYAALNLVRYPITQQIMDELGVSVDKALTRLRSPLRFCWMPAVRPPKGGPVPNFGYDPYRRMNIDFSYVGIGFVPMFGPECPSDVLENYTTFHYEFDKLPLSNFPRYREV